MQRTVGTHLIKNYCNFHTRQGMEMKRTKLTASIDVALHQRILNLQNRIQRRGEEMTQSTARITFRIQKCIELQNN